MSQRVYYKVSDKNSELFKKATDFLLMEEELRANQKKAIEARLPKFTVYRGVRGFNRIVRYEGFVFDKIEEIDAKTWTTKLVEGKFYSSPYMRTKSGRAMDRFLREFDRTTCWDVDNLLKIELQSINGSFYPADLFKHKDTIYITIDSRLMENFEQNNADAVEITCGAYIKAMNEYNNE